MSKNKELTKITKKKELAKTIDKALGNSSSNDIIVTKTELNQQWEDLDSLYSDIAGSIGELAHKVSHIINSYKQISAVIPSDMAVAVKTLYADLDSITEDLITIQAGHINKKGKVKNEEELSDLLENFNKYCLLFDRFKALTFQELLIITEHTMSLSQENSGKTTNTSEVVTKDSIKEKSEV